MSGGGSSAPSFMFLPQQQQSTQTTENKLPQWVQDAGVANYNLAQNMNPAAFAAYTGPRFADLNSGQLNTIKQLNNNVGSYDNSYNSALNTTNALQNYSPSQVNGLSLAGTNLSSYMSPYTNDVINSSLNILDQQRQNNLNTNHDQAVASKAFGGSRQQIQDAITNSQYGLQGANLAANLYNQNFQNAQGAAQQDIANNLQSQLANQSAGLQGANLNLNAANQMGNLATGQQQNFLNAANAAYTGNSALQQQNQNQINAAMQQYADQQQSMLAPLQLRMSALGMTPYNTSTTGTGSSSGFTSQAYQPTSSNPFMGALGGGLAGAQFGPWGAAAGAGLGLLSGIRR